MKLHLVLLAGIALAAPGEAQRRATPNFHSFLQRYLGDPTYRRLAPETRYASALVDLNADRRPEIVVYVSGYCGSGGCDMYVFTPSGRSWRAVASMGVTRTPIRVLNSRTRGWRDLSVIVAGGGLSRREMLLAFNGRRYPINPTVPPARLLRRSPPGRVLIPESAIGRRLFD